MSSPSHFLKLNNRYCHNSDEVITNISGGIDAEYRQMALRSVLYIHQSFWDIICTYLDQNLHWKLGQLTPFLIYLDSMALGIKLFFLLFKKESWNFLVSVETSQNLKSFSSFRHLLFTFFLTDVWLSWNFMRLQNSFSNRCGKFQLSILKNKKGFIPKKNIF